MQKATFRTIIAGLMVIMGLSLLFTFSAQACPPRPIYGLTGMAGLEISGSSYAGAQLVNTKQVTHGGTNDCFSWSNYKSVSHSIGGIISSGANGMACIRTSGNARGYVSGTGNFVAGASGTMFGCSYYTYSNIHMQGAGY